MSNPKDSENDLYYISILDELPSPVDKAHRASWGDSGDHTGKAEEHNNGYTAPTSPTALPILRAGEVVAPQTSLNALEILMNSDPRVAFDALHLSLLECIEEELEHAGGQADRAAKRMKHEDESRLEESDTPHRPHTYLRYPSSTKASIARGKMAENDHNPSPRYVEVQPFHKMVSERTPFVVDLMQAQRVTYEHRRPLLYVHAGSSLLDLLNYGEDIV